MQQEPQKTFRRSVIEETNNWHNSVLGEVLEFLEERCSGTMCLSTPDGDGVEINVRFFVAGKA